MKGEHTMRLTGFLSSQTKEVCRCQYWNEVITFTKTASSEGVNDKTLTEKIGELTSKQKKELSNYINIIRT